VRRLPRTEQLIFVRGEAPIHCALADYRSARDFVGGFDENPMHGNSPP
jgi:hypothetical protein